MKRITHSSSVAPALAFAFLVAIPVSGCVTSGPVLQTTRGSRSCLGQDASPSGECALPLGVVWNGTACVSISGCECEGDDCDDLYASIAECEADFTTCVECSSDTDCGATESCFFPDGACGAPGTCSPIPPSLPCDPAAEPVCGCDGETYACDAAAISAGVSIDRDGRCAPTGCTAQDATGTGACAAVFGIFWNGTACTSYSGCDCEGADCAAAYESVAACEADYASCIEPTGCDSDDDCGGDICYFAEGVCGGPGECSPIPPSLPCGPSDAEVCGCDGVTYDCHGQATSNGISIDHEGRCGPAPSCDAMEAAPEGECALPLGIVWNGATCESISGCECVGADCSLLYRSFETCEEDHRDCAEGCFSTAECGDQYCFFPDGMCGGPGECGPIPPGLPCMDTEPQVCGCDEVTYDCAGQATSAGISVQHEGPC